MNEGDWTTVDRRHPRKPLIMAWTERISRFRSIINDKIMFLDGILSPAKFGLTGDMNSHFTNFKYPFFSHLFSSCNVVNL